MSPESVSVVTRTKNRPLLIPRAIESILNQSHEDWVHIIVNDGGDRKVLDGIIDKYRAPYRARLNIIDNPTSLGRGPALNIGMRAATCVYVVTHDDDDSWEPEFLEKSIRALKTRKALIRNTRGIACHTTAVHEKINASAIVEKYRYSFNGWMKVVTLSRLSAGNFMPPISFLFERDVFSKIGLFDDALNFAEDWEFYLRFLSQFDIAVLPEHLANYHFRTRSGLYGNTVTDSLDSHIVVAAGIRNDLIRRDISSGKFGLGSLIALSSSSPLGVNVKHELWIVVHRMIAVLSPKTLIRRILNVLRS